MCNHSVELIAFNKVAFLLSEICHTLYQLPSNSPRLQRGLLRSTPACRLLTLQRQRADRFVMRH